MVKRIKNIIVSKYQPKSKNTAWFDGKELRIISDGNDKNVYSDFYIRRSDLFLKTPRAFELAKIFADAYIGYDEVDEEYYIDYTKIPNIKIIKDNMKYSADSDTVSNEYVLIPNTISHQVMLWSDPKFKVLNITFSLYDSDETSFCQLQFSFKFDMYSRQITDEMYTTWNVINN